MPSYLGWAAHRRYRILAILQVHANKANVKQTGIDTIAIAYIRFNRAVFAGHSVRQHSTGVPGVIILNVKSFHIGLRSTSALCSWKVISSVMTVSLMLWLAKYLQRGRAACVWFRIKMHDDHSFV